MHEVRVINYVERYLHFDDQVKQHDNNSYNIESKINGNSYGNSEYWQ